MTTELTPRQQIEAVIELLSDKSRWTQGQSARDSEGRPVEPDSPYAVCWCVEGALHKVSGDWRVFSQPIWETLLDMNNNTAPHHTNDKEGYDAVMALLNKVLEKL
jgi:hypothetical protein